MSFGERLLALRKTRKISQTELARVMGCSQPTIYEYERNRVNPSIQAIQSLANEFGVNLHWLLAGQGPMYISENIQVTDRFEELKQEMDKSIAKSVDKILEKKLATYFKGGMPLMITTEQPSPEEVNEFWYLKIKGDIACGTPIEFVEDISERLIPVSKKLLPNPAECDILRVNGDSMLPDIEHGDLVVIRKENDWHICNNRIVAVRTSDGVTLKKMHCNEKAKATMLLASNPKYPPLLVDDQCHLCGYLLLLIRYF